MIFYQEKPNEVSHVTMHSLRGSIPTAAVIDVHERGLVYRACVTCLLTHARTLSGINYCSIGVLNFLAMIIATYYACGFGHKIIFLPLKFFLILGRIRNSVPKEQAQMGVGWLWRVSWRVHGCGMQHPQ